MKVLFINSEYPPVGGGAGNASANLARLLVQRGSEVVVVTAAFHGLSNDETVDGVRILRGPAGRGRIDRSSALEQVIFIAGAALRCLRLMRGFKPDVVLAFFGLPSGAVAWMLRDTFGIPYVVSLRGGDVPGFRPYDFWLYHKLAVPLLRVIWHEASAVIANSEGLRKLALAFDSTADIVVVPNGVDPHKFPTSDRAWSPPRILTVSRVVHQKGLDLALTALAELNDLEWEWRLAGDGPLLPPLRQMVREHNLVERVHFLGWQSAGALREEYAKANLFLFPSRDEGMPNAVLEAMASGLPVLATRISGNEEVVLSGETGLLVPAENAEALRQALRELLPDGEKRERMGDAGRGRAERTFGWQPVADRYHAILEKALQ
jgi:glycosyltransferase involved in cell wall biosynthesis